MHPDQTVAEVLEIMRRHQVKELPLYYESHFVEQVLYAELMNFLGRPDDRMNPYYHKISFDIGTAMMMIRNERLSVQLDVINDKVRRRLDLYEQFKKLLPQAVAALVVLLGIVIWFVGGAGSGAGPDTVSYRSVSTEAGLTKSVILPDGTKIWLNAKSTVRFPVSFDGLAERLVILDGEAYFIVKHNRKQPFRVHSGHQVVEDIGTEFNIRAYWDERNVTTTLVEGMAKVAPQPDSRIKFQSILLRPGQQAVLTAGVIRLRSVDAKEVKDWRNGEFVFENERLDLIMGELARWYAIKVIYENKHVANSVFAGSIDRSEKLSDALEVLELTGDVSFRVEGSTVFVF